jgi:tRNA-splicing ligase RtcB
MKDFAIYGQHDEATIQQLRNCLAPEPAVAGALLADGHLGYAMPIGGVVAYRNHVSPNGVGFDISCGVMAVKTDIREEDLYFLGLDAVADEIFETIPFGVGRKSGKAADHELFDDPRWDVLPEIRDLKQLAAQQLGTVGSGNHYVDVLVDEEDTVWVATHFGSRGFGHKTATGFLNLAAGRAWGAKVPPGEDSAASTPVLLDLDTELGQAYWAAMELAGRYAYAGRAEVVGQVLDILEAEAVSTVHNHHNFSWRQRFGDEELVVVRKGATPAAPGQQGFVGGSMGDISVIVEGVDTPEARATLCSTVHGAGRVMSRSKALGKVDRKTGEVKRMGLVTPEMMQSSLERFSVVLRGGGRDEAPQVYRSLPGVLEAMGPTIKVVRTLTPRIVAMAGKDVRDPYKD